MNISEIKKQIECQYTRILKTKTLIESIDKNIKEPYEIDNADCFFSIIANFLPQSKAPEVEKWIARKMGWKKIPSSMGRGDFQDKEGKYYELKTSFTNKNKSLNFRQVRLWQPVDYYIGLYIDEDNLKYYFVFLNKNQMKYEMQNASATHGTKESNQMNEHIELSKSILIHSKEMSRFLSEYQNAEMYNKLFIG